jgi:hypothetical protein
MDGDLRTNRVEMGQDDISKDEGVRRKWHA